MTCVFISAIDSPHLELSLLGQGDKSVVFFAAQGWDTLYRRGVHILSALGFALRRDRWGTRAFSRVGGRIWLRSLAFLFHFVNASINLKKRFNQFRTIRSLSTITWEKCKLIASDSIYSNSMYYYHRILYTLHYVLQTLKHTWICSLHNIFPSVKHTCTIHKVHIATQKMVSHSEGNMNDRSFISHTTLILTNGISEVTCDVMLWHKSSMLHVLAEKCDNQTGVWYI